MERWRERERTGKTAQSKTENVGGVRESENPSFCEGAGGVGWEEVGGGVLVGILERKIWRRRLVEV